MFAIERIRLLKNQLIKEKNISVGKMSEFLGVTEVTIRRDLIKLEKEGFIRRTHGGAILIETCTESPLQPIIDDSSTYKQEIATIAHHLVSDGDVIMIMDGPTNLELAKKLIIKDNLTIVTNDLRIALEYVTHPTSNLIVLGGDLNKHGLYGQLSIDNMSKFSFKHLFIELDGIDHQLNFTVSSINKASLIQHAISLSDTINVICLSKHFGKPSLFRAGNIQLADKFLTDSNIDDTYKDQIFSSNIPLYTSIDIIEN